MLSFNFACHAASGFSLSIINSVKQTKLVEGQPDHWREGVSSLRVEDLRLKISCARTDKCTREPVDQCIASTQHFLSWPPRIWVCSSFGWPCLTRLLDLVPSSFIKLNRLATPCDVAGTAWPTSEARRRAEGNSGRCKSPLLGFAATGRGELAASGTLT